LIDLWQPAVTLSAQSLGKGAGNRHWEDSILTATDSADLVSIPALLARNAREFGDKAAYREKEFGIWQSWTWVEVVEQVEALALGLLSLGAAKGDHVAIAGRNRPHLYWAMLAAQSIGAVPVPIYQDAVGDEIAYVLDHCNARFIVAGDQEQVDKILDIRDSLKNLQTIIYLDPRGLRKYDHSILKQYQSLQEEGRVARGDLGDELAKRQTVQTYDDTCVMLYTSGTTGRPKGVVLSNRNVIETSKNSSQFDDLGPGEEVLAYLPMAWVGDYTFSMGQALWTGFCVNCPESAETMMTDLREIGPTYYFAPPRVFENQLTNVMIRMEDASRLKKWMFDKAMAHAKRVGPALLSGMSIGFMDRVKYFLGDIFIYGPLKNTLGLSRVRIGYTAGEAIGPELFDFYRSLGINLKQLYGQTEATVYVTIQPDGEVRADTVGIPAPGVEVRIGDNGEIYYRSPGVFVEYYNNPESTASTKDAEGWVATGDAGFFEKDTGHLRIIDRAKDVGKMADGSLFAPKYVENKLKFYPNILEAVVFGSGRDYCTAFVNIDLNAVGNWAERNNIAYGGYQELSQHPKVLDMIQAHIEETNQSIAQDPMLSGCQVSRFLVLHKELDADDGEMTRTRKVRRRTVEDKFDDLIAGLYGGVGFVETTTEVTYEDGRKGSISAKLELRDAALAVEQQVAAQ
jgi:long-chain acyl-CoA synthetase